MSSCCQVYDPTKVTEEAIDATANIFYTSGGKSKTDIVMYKPSSTTYDYIGVPFSQAVVVMEQKIILRSLL